MRKLLTGLLSLLFIGCLSVGLAACENEKEKDDLKFIRSEDENYYILRQINCEDTDIVIPANYKGLPVKEISQQALLKENLSTLTIPSTVTRIGFMIADNIPSNINTIHFMGTAQDWCNIQFNTCSTESGTIGLLTSVEELYIDGKLFTGELPDTVTSIQPYAFFNFNSLSTLTIPSSVTSIDESAFARCNGLNSVTVEGNSATKIEKNVFQSCLNLKNVTIGDSITSVGESAFKNCQALESVVLGASITTIEAGAFSYCSALKNTTFGNSLERIEDGAFNLCSSLTTITIPENVTHIGHSAFANCTNLQSLTLGKSLQTMGAHAFSCCSSLTSVTIPSSVTSIGARAFTSCAALTSVVFENPTGWTDKYGKAVDFSDAEETAEALKYSSNSYTRS